MEDLKPCPFCGCRCYISPCTWQTAMHYEHEHGYKVVGAHKEECIFKLLLWDSDFESREHIADAWNRRAE